MTKADEQRGGRNIQERGKQKQPKRQRQACGGGYDVDLARTQGAGLRRKNDLSIEHKLLRGHRAGSALEHRQYLKPERTDTVQLCDMRQMCA